MALITRTNYVSGGTITAAGQNTNENTVFDEFNGNIDNANIKAAAGIDPTKIAGASSEIILLADSAAFPSANAPASATINGTNVSYGVLDFDAGTDESCFWKWIMPGGYVTGNITIDILWQAGATSGDVIWAVQTAGVQANNAEAVDVSLGSARTITDTAQGTANHLAKATIVAFSPGWVAGDLCFLKLYRDADAAGDTMTGDARLISMSINLRP